MEVKLRPEKEMPTLKEITKHKNIIQFRVCSVLLGDRNQKFALKLNFYFMDNTESEMKEIVLDNNMTAKDCITAIVESGIFRKEIEKNELMLNNIRVKGYCLGLTLLNRRKSMITKSIEGDL